uniref:Uncharacterized protein n=1 Tax=Sphaerodactylus townsendi TaxID=933632 RepID=A0ACB8F3Y6_9SAUR
MCFLCCVWPHTGIDPPRNLTIDNVTTDSVTIHWASPIASFDHYRIAYKSAQGRVDSIVIAKRVTEYTLSHLQPATEYEISLKSVRGREESEPLSRIMYTGTQFLDEYEGTPGIYL